MESSGNSVLCKKKKEKRNSMKVYIFRFINIPSTNQTRDLLDTPHAAREGYRQSRITVMTVPENLLQSRCDFRRQLFPQNEKFYVFSAVHNSYISAF